MGGRDSVAQQGVVGGAEGGQEDRADKEEPGGGVHQQEHRAEKEISCSPLRITGKNKQRKVETRGHNKVEDNSAEIASVQDTNIRRELRERGVEETGIGEREVLAVRV